VTRTRQSGGPRTFSRKRGPKAERKGGLDRQAGGKGPGGSYRQGDMKKGVGGEKEMSLRFESLGKGEGALYINKGGKELSLHRKKNKETEEGGKGFERRRFLRGG